jgi:hypothetical protein
MASIEEHEAVGHHEPEPTLDGGLVSEKGFAGQLVQSIFEVGPVTRTLDVRSDILARGKQRSHPRHERLVLSPHHRPLWTRFLDRLGLSRSDDARRLYASVGIDDLASRDTTMKGQASDKQVRA